MNRIAAMATSGTSDEPADPLLASENMPDTHDNATEININSSLKHRADKHTTPTLSHGIASENTDIIGDEQPRWRDSPAVEVGDLGWNTASNQMIRPIVEGVRNERLWTILRRFNQQTFEVRQIDETMLKNLDMSIGEDEEFSPDKLRAHLERLYVTVGLGCMSAWKHIARVRSWKEPNRTWTFFSVYYVSWLLDLLLPAIVLCALVLVISPPVRTLCFPPAPLALVDAASGGVQRPAAGLLATADTMTGAPEAFDGEGAEREAHNVINTIATMALATTAGQHPDGDVHDDNQTPDPTELANDVADAKNDACGNGSSATYDKTKEPVSKAMWKQAASVMRAVAGFVDTWERFANAMSPTSPFPKHAPRRKLAACLLPVFFASWLCTAYMLVKGISLIAGFILFGQPILTRVAALLERTFPKWQRLVALQNSVVRDVPTNAQLAITLLRTGERNGTPIPPPPEPTTAPPMETNKKAVREVDLGATETEIQEAARPQKAGEMASQLPTRQHPRPNGKAHVAVAMLKRFAKSIVNTSIRP